MKNHQNPKKTPGKTMKNGTNPGKAKGKSSKTTKNLGNPRKPRKPDGGAPPIARAGRYYDDDTLHNVITVLKCQDPKQYIALP